MWMKGLWTNGMKKQTKNRACGDWGWGKDLYIICSVEPIHALPLTLLMKPKPICIEVCVKMGNFMEGFNAV